MEYEKEFLIDDNIAVQIAKDEDGRVFHNIKCKTRQSAIFCMDGKNKKLFGFPKVVFRKGNSVYGEEIYFQFWIVEKGDEYDASSKWENMEFYFSTDAGYKFLKAVVDYIKKIKEGKDGID